ncbi:MAG TPA: carbohydrate porin [Acidobacteriaceae bacterium]|nr:carbohydrate porin [Acidobacteriaceae bacterium]
MGPVASPQRTLDEAGKHGVAFQYQYTHDLSAIPLGNSMEHGWFGRSTWTLSAAVDLEKTMGWRGTSGVVSMKQHVLEFGRMDRGFAQGYSNLDADPYTMLYEGWIQQQTLGGKLTLKAGQMDSNADFDALPLAGDFLNSSMGYSPTVMEFPSYPVPQPAVEALANLGRATRVAAGEFRTAGGRMSLFQGDRTWAIGTGERAGRAAVGMWHLTESLARPDGVAVRGTNGFYGVLEQSLWNGPLADGKTRTLSGYLQAGTGAARVNPFRAHLGGGVVMSGQWGKRPSDAVGAAASWVDLGSAGRETVVETYYKLCLGKAVSLVPDVQYFRNPGGSPHGEALVVTPRLVFAF